MSLFRRASDFTADHPITAISAVAGTLAGVHMGIVENKSNGPLLQTIAAAGCGAIYGCLTGGAVHYFGSVGFFFVGGGIVAVMTQRRN